MDDLGAFVKVVEHGNFSKAAREMGNTPSAVSKLISRLEEKLHVRLLNRTTRAVSLTEEGRVYYERARAILDEVRDMELTVRDMQAKPTGTLRITSSPSFGTSILMGALKAYCDQYPDVRLDIALDAEHNDIVAEGFDLALREGEISDSRLIARKLTDSRFVACAPPGYFAHRPRPTNISEFFALDCIFWMNARVEEIARRWFGPDLTPGQINLKMQINSFHGIRAAVRDGLGVSLMPCYFVEQDVRDGRIEIIPDLAIPSMPIYLMYPSRKLMSPKVRAAIDHLTGYFQADQPLAEHREACIVHAAQDVAGPVSADRNRDHTSSSASADADVASA